MSAVRWRAHTEIPESAEPFTALLAVADEDDPDAGDSKFFLLGGIWHWRNGKWSDENNDNRVPPADGFWWLPERELMDTLEAQVFGHTSGASLPVIELDIDRIHRTALGARDAQVTDSVTSRRVLDPCCGGRMMWFDRSNPDVVFGDIRREQLTVTDRSHGREEGTRVLNIDPDVLLDFRALPYADGSFRLVAFDPPHMVRAGPKSWLAAKYGKLGTDWRDDLRAGFVECFRVLASDGVLVFKWNETQIKLREVLALTPHQPLLGNTSGKKAGTHWLVFIKSSEAS